MRCSALFPGEWAGGVSRHGLGAHDSATLLDLVSAWMGKFIWKFSACCLDHNDAELFQGFRMFCMYSLCVFLTTTLQGRHDYSHIAAGVLGESSLPKANYEKIVWQR